MTKPVSLLRLAAGSGLAALLGACTTAGPAAPTPAPPPRVVPQAPPPANPAPPPQRAPGDPRIMTLPGLETIIGLDANALTGIYGAPRLDVREGDVRKLQYRGEACVLDIYLYPVAGRQQPVATWVEARRASDGLDVDRASCAAALRER